MHGSTSGRLREAANLRRVVEALFHAVRIEFDVDEQVVLELAEPSGIGHSDERQHVAVLCLACIQLVHRLSQSTTFDDDYATVLALTGTIDAALNHLLDGNPPRTASSRSIRARHSDLRNLVLRLT